MPADSREALGAWARILTGVVKMAALAPWVYHAFEFAGDPPRMRIMLRVLINFYAFPIWLYLNFSGYTDVVIGAARLLGFPLPENFNRPYLARNIIDFWNRWHISLSHWVRDYVFMTSYKTAVLRFPQRGKYLGYAFLFLALFVAGIWHGSTGNFVIFGALHGLGARSISFRRMPSRLAGAEPPCSATWPTT